MQTKPQTVAIIGGGLGGLLTALQLQRRCLAPVDATIYEASPRVGGKVLSPQFSSAPVRYEGGVAELYDYSHVGDDPLRRLVAELNLRVRPLNGAAVVLNDRVVSDLDATRTQLGEATWSALRRFDCEAKEWMTPLAYYEADWIHAAQDPKITETFHSLLASVPDAAARRYLKCLVHSDLATEPHQTNASYGLQNYLMNDPAYLRLYTIVGGIERLPRAVAANLSATIRLNEPVIAVGLQEDGSLRVDSRRSGALVSELFDYVVAALPNDSLPAIDWRGERLADAMHQHHVQYDHPAHYVRVSILFREPFWRGHIDGSYIMLDAFGGCCLYDESPVDGRAPNGVLGWLLAGEAAMRLGNLSDQALVQMVLDSLPPFLRHGRELFVEAKVHRWIGAVNGLPGGVPALDMDSRHVPEPIEHPNLFVVGDYLFDSTINGVLDSADFVAEWLAEDLQETADAAEMSAVEQTPSTVS